MRAGDYLRRNVFASFQDDPVGPLTYKLFGTDNYLWSSDYLHIDIDAVHRGHPTHRL
jgi:hypothetical protein